MVKNTTFLYKEIVNATGDESRVLADEPLKNHTTFKTGGPADIMVMPQSEEEIIRITEIISRQPSEIKLLILGNGSNVLVKDKGFRGVVIKIGNEMSDITVSGDEIRAQSGALLSAVSQAAAGASLAGMEFASGIPGSIGGGLFMNAGAYGGEMSQIVKSAKAVMPDGHIEEFSAEELNLSYRHSVFTDNNGIITEVTLSLKTGDETEIRALMKDLNARRMEKQPLNFASAGSTFKRPEGYFAGKLIQDSGCKGLSVGGALVSPKHAGFVVNTGDATAQDVLDLIALVQMRVKEKFDVDMETEVRIVGE